MYTLLIKDVDKTSLIKSGTLSINKGADNEKELSVSLLTTSAYTNIIGHDIKVMDDTTTVFGGVIKSANIRKIEPGLGTTKELILDVTSYGYNDIPARRTTNAYYTDKYAGEIAELIRTNVLNLTGASDDIGAGTISNGALYTEFAVTYKSVKEIYDELAESSGFKWYIDDAKNLNFVAEDTVVNAAHDIVEGGAFTDYNITDIEVSMTDYRNKQFVVGGTDADGLTVMTVVSDTTEITARQTAEGSTYSSGVYGNVINDYTIETEAQAIIVAENALKKYSMTPSVISFESHTNDWIAGTKLKVNIPTLSISTDTYYLIENVLIQDYDGLNLVTTVTASVRKSADFSTQRTENWKDYFAELTKKGEYYNNTVFNTDGTAYSVQIYVQDDTPTGAKSKALWVDTNDYSRYDKTALTAETTLTENSNEFITASGTFTMTLHAATSSGIIKKIYNIGTGIITIAGTINGATNMILYPGESVELITDGTVWRC